MTLNTKSAHQRALARTGYELRSELVRHRWRLGRLFASHCLEIALMLISEQLDFDPMATILEARCMCWPCSDADGFRKTTLATLEREGRKLLAKGQDDAAMAAAALWYALKYDSNPTGHDLLDLVASWQTDAARQ